MHFCIPLLPKARAGDWDLVVRLLEQTLRSLQNQTCKDFSVIICGHDQPDLQGHYDFDIGFLRAAWPLHRPGSGAHKDKRWKRDHLIDEVERRGGGYFMFLDADDLVHGNFVRSVLDAKAPHGYIVEEGYGIDFGSRLIAPIPSAWPEPFHFYCGSCAVFNMAPSAVGQDDGRGSADLFKKLRSHTKWKSVMSQAGMPLHPLPFPAVAYLLNHGENTHSKVDDERDQFVRLLMEKSGRPITAEHAGEFGLA